MRSDKKTPLKSDKKAPSKVQKKGSIGYNKKSALLEDAITQMNAGKYGRASSALKDLLALDPLNAEARRLFATLHLRLGSLISARTAFESLAREAMERQDYWLAESLLREYLTAGPRYVPFLEMLGHVYEDKGDVMAAVAEYGKAVEVLLEDPDTERPNRASDLFVRIRSLAPGSPVAFRFAAMFDTVTGQVVQVTPQPAVPDSRSEPSPVEPESGSPVDSAAAMPWEQVEPLPAEAPVEQELPVLPAEPSTETRDSVVLPPMPVETVIAAGPQDAPLDQSAAPQAAASDPVLESQVPAEPFSSPVASVEEPAATSTQTEPPMAGPVPASTEEAELPAPSVAEESQPTIGMLAQTSGHPIAQAPSSPAPMPWDQIEEVAVVIPPASIIQGSTTPEDVAVVSPEAELPASPSRDRVTPPIEILAQTSSPPIAEAPSSLTPMPWDEVEDTTNVFHPLVEATGERDVVEADKAVEPITTNYQLGSEMVTDPPSSSSPSETTSSGLSWEEILAAVAAMQTSPAPAQSLPSAENEPVHDRGLIDEPVPAALDSKETESWSHETPVSDALVDPGSAVPALSAPMPWEQIEVDDVAIPRQEPEPEFGSVLAATIEGVQDLTLVVPVEPEMPETVAVVEVLAGGAEADRPVEVAADSQSELPILSPDAPIEPQTPPIHIPEVAYEAPPEEIQETVLDDGESVGFVVERSAETLLRMAGSKSILSAPADESPAVAVEPVTEFSIAADRDEPIAAASSETVLSVEQPVDAMSAQEAVTPPVLETVAESAIFPASPSGERDVADSSLNGPAVPPIEASLVPADPVQEAQSPSSTQESMVAPVEESVQLPVESTQASEPVPSADLLEVLAEPVAPADAPAASAPPEPAAGDGLRILWETDSSAPIPSASTGNMLTRWLRRPAEIVPTHAGAATSPVTVPDEPPASASPLSVVEAVPAAALVEQPLDSVVEAPLAREEEPAHRPKPSQPVGGLLWSRVGEAAAALVGAGVSTTRSLVVLVLALIGLALVLVGGAVGAVALTWLILEEQPSAAYRNMTSIPQHTLEDPSKNGYFILLGFDAAAKQDPVQAGMDRRVEGVDRAFTHTCLTGEGYAPGGDQSASAEAAGKWMKTADPASQMHLNATGVHTWVSQTEVGLGRYRQWLNKPFEDVGYGQPVSPNCGLVLQTHRLYVAEGFAQDVETGVARLETDLTAWRTVLGQAKTLPVKMLAGAAMNDDIAVIDGLLQRPELEERFVSRLAKLARPLEQAELSVRWPMQSQFVLAAKTLDEAVTQGRADAGSLYGSIAAALPLPKQRRFNAYAQYYDAAGKAAGEGRYADLPKQSQFVHAPPYGVGDLLVNPIESLVGVDPLPTWETYAGRVLETDARLRLASLQAWLRRTPPEQDLLTRIAKAGQGFYDPFSGFPMLVNMKKGVLYSVGQDLKDNDAHERLDLVASIPSAAWVGGTRPAEVGKTK